METQKQASNNEEQFFQETYQGYQPKISMRGLHIDISRHFIPLEIILKITDIMNKLKLNALHLHLSDDQGFPIELNCLEKYPNSLQNLLKNASNQQQQQNQNSKNIQKILTIKEQEILFFECQKKNIQIIPEIDVPGHTQAFQSIFDENIKPATKMGIITNEYIDIEQHLPILLEIFEELVIRFQAKYFHMGGDEAQNYKEFEKLIQNILNWAQKMKIQIIAWDEVITAVNWGDNFPFETLIIQQWRGSGKNDFRTLVNKFPQTKLILSHGYYLDHVLDPIKIYTQSPQQSEIIPFGCIACTWTELIDENNILSSIFPVMYAAAHRWYYFPGKFVLNIIGELLYKISEELGYYDCQGFENSWKCRHWFGFYSEQPRSTSSVTVFDELNREQDKYPVFSKGMIKILYYFERYMKSNNKKQQEQLKDIYDENTEKMIIQIGNEAIPKEILAEIQEENILFILRKTQGWQIKLKKIVEGLKKVQEQENQTLKQLYRNGFLPILQYVMSL